MVGDLEQFEQTLYMAAELSGTTVHTITRPIYLNMCQVNGIRGWTKEQIQEYGKGWAELKREAIRYHLKYLAEFADGESPVRDYYLTHPEDKNTSMGTPCVAVDEEAEIKHYVENQKDIYLAEYADYIKTHKFVPTFNTFKKWYNNTIERVVYDKIQDIDEDYRCHYKEEAEKYLFDKNSWTEEYKEAFRKEVKKHNTFILVSVGSFCDIDWAFVQSLATYAKENNAMIIGLPLFKKYDKALLDFSTDPALREYMWITFEDVILNDNLMAQVIKANCTTKSTITGLNQIVAKYDSSIIVAGINQQLKYIPVLKDKTPNMIASTGCCTKYQPVRKDDMIIPTKAEKLACERTSITGALIVELGQNQTFTVRNVEAGKHGHIVDLGIMYNPEYSEPCDGATFVIGDLHAPKHNEVLLQANIDAIKNYGCTRVVLHDSVNMTYISHHNADQAITRAQLVEEGRADIITEVAAFVDILQQLTDIETVDEVIIPYSNHPQHFDKFIQDISRMSKDDINLRTSLMTALAMLDNKNTLQYLVEEIVGFKNPKVQWIDEDKGVEHYGVQVGLHGSERVNGGRMTATSTNNAFRKTVLAHRHSASIDGDTITVGIACEKEQGYNHGLSSWTESSAIVYPNGTVQLLTFVNVKGEYILWL